MATINFPETRGQCVPPIGAAGNNNPLQDGDESNVTAPDGTVYRFQFKSDGQATPVTWWKSLGQTPNAFPNPPDKIEEESTKAEVQDSDNNDGQFFVRTNGTNRLQIDSTGDVNIGPDFGNPTIELKPEGRIDVDRTSDAGWFAQWSDTNNVRFGVAADGVVVLKNTSDENEVVLSPTGDTRYNNTVRIGNDVATTNGNTELIRLDSSGNGVFGSSPSTTNSNPGVRINQSKGGTTGWINCYRGGIQVFENNSSTSVNYAELNPSGQLLLDNRQTTAYVATNSLPERAIELKQASSTNDTYVALAARLGTSTAGTQAEASICFVRTASQTSDITFRTSNPGNSRSREVASIDSLGRLKFVSGGGINFHDYGAGANVDSNLLDDYEEGNWTPVIEGGWNSIVYSPATKGNYTKIGNFVTVRCKLIVDTATSASTAWKITGLPFTANDFGSGCWSYLGDEFAPFTSPISLPDTGQTMIPYIGSATTEILPYFIPNVTATPATKQSVANANITSATYFYCTISYFTNQ